MVLGAIFGAAIGVAGLAGAVPPAANPAPQVQASKTGMVTASNPQSVVDALQAVRYRAKLTKDKTGDPMIESAVGGGGVFRPLLWMFRRKKLHKPGI